MKKLTIVFRSSGTRTTPFDRFEYGKILYDKTAEIGKLVFYTAWELANQDKRIQVDRINDFLEK